MCASSNWRSVRTSTIRAPSAAGGPRPGGGEWHHLHASGEQRPAVELHDRLEVRRLGAQAGQRALHELLLVAGGEQRVVAPLEADRRGDLHGPCPARRRASLRGGRARPRSRAGAAAASRAGCGRPRAPLLLVDGEIGARHVAHEQAVAGKKRPGLLAPCGVDQREGGVLGAVAGRVDRAHGERAELELVAVLERLVVVIRRRQAVHVDG